jgi:hypothetical protein
MFSYDWMVCARSTWRLKALNSSTSTCILERHTISMASYRYNFDLPDLLLRNPGLKCLAMSLHWKNGVLHLYTGLQQLDHENIQNELDSSFLPVRGHHGTIAHVLNSRLPGAHHSPFAPPLPDQKLHIYSLGEDDDRLLQMRRELQKTVDCGFAHHNNQLVNWTLLLLKRHFCTYPQPYQRQGSVSSTMNDRYRVHCHLRNDSKVGTIDFERLEQLAEKMPSPTNEEVVYWPSLAPPGSFTRWAY